MERVSAIFSMLFFIGAVVSFAWGFQIIRLNSKSNINRMFLLMCLALSIWSFGFAMANSQTSLSAALFWRRYSAIGWTSIFSIILHFLLLATRKTDKHSLNKYYLLLHLPAIISMYVFAFSNNMAPIQYNLVKIDYGWTNIAKNNGWDIFYYAYYLVYMIASTVVVWKWSRRIKDRIKVRQAKFILLAIISAAIPGAIIDLTVNTFLDKPLPQMAPLFILFPVWSMYYFAKHYDILGVKKIRREELIITSQQQEEIFISFSIGIMISGILSFLFEYYSSSSDNMGNLRTSLSKSSLLLILGAIIFLLQRIKKEELKEKLTSIVLLASIPLVSFQFLNYSTITVWAYSMIIIISSLLFDNRRLLTATTVVAIITQRLVWILKPDSYILVDGYDFILRMLLLTLAFFLGSYVNKIYIAKIRENNQQISFQKLVSNITLDLVGFNEENSYEKLNSLLEKTGKFFNVDRSYIFTIDHNNSTMTYSNEWCNHGISREVGIIENLPIDTFPWWIDQLEKQKKVYIEDVSLLPKEAGSEQDQLYRQGVKSLMALPVIRDSKIHAFIGMDSVKENNKWSKKDIEMLRIIANILSNVLTPVQIDRETKFKAYHDSLTKLPNRFLFSDKLDQEISIAKKSDKNIAVVFLDLDGFKAINDSIGHRGGDQLLKQVAQALKKVGGPTDTIARFGGDEFLIMIDSIDNKDEIREVADKIMTVFSSPFRVEEQEFQVTASAGIAVYPTDGEKAEVLIRNADLAMYKAKSKGKNQYIIASKEMKEKVEMNIELSNDISKALKRDEFLVYYQPQIDPITGKIIGLEALIRWIHPTRGMLSPGIFIPIAEKNNLINKIGEWVLKTACLQMKRWEDMGLGELNLAVNLSVVQIMNPKLNENIKRIIQESQLDPKYVGLEITESIAIKETEYVLEALNKLKDLGISIAIDDFGTEYSSFTRLKILPVDQIKIDMEFVQGIEENEKDKVIIMVIINLAHKLGLNVLAEGVETKRQLDFLIQEKCDIVQGYYYYKPMPADEIEKLLISQKNEKKSKQKT